EPGEGRAHDGQREKMFGERKRMLGRIEDVRVEEVHRVARKLMRHPGERPFDQESVAVVVAGQCAGMGGKWPGVRDGKRYEKYKHCDVRAAQEATGELQGHRGTLPCGRDNIGSSSRRSDDHR